MAERRPAAQREIDAAAEIGRRDALRGYAVDRAGERRREKPGGIDEEAAPQRRRLGAADRELEPALAHPARQHRRAKRHSGARRLSLALIGEHQRVAVDDPGQRRQQRRDAVEFGFETLRLGLAQPFEIGDTVGARRGRDLFDPRDLGLAGGDDQLAEPGMRHAVLAAIGVEGLAAGDAAGRLHAALRIVEAAMDDLAVARGCPKPIV